VAQKDVPDRNKQQVRGSACRIERLLLNLRGFALGTT
jgi:hypothetical protein